jgi:hypothetical protein
MGARRTLVRLMAVAGVAVAGVLAAPPPAFAARLVLSDVVNFKVTRTAAGGLTTSACKLKSDAEAGGALEPAQKCVISVSNYPQGNGVVRVPNDPTEMINFSFTVGPDGAVTGRGVETEVVNDHVVSNDVTLKGSSTQVSPGVYRLVFKFSEVPTAP